MTLSLALAIATASIPASAWHECVQTGPNSEATLETPLGTYYVDNDDCQPRCVASTWVYEESNGIWGLQRQDAVVDDTCGGLNGMRGDTIVASVYRWP